MGPPVRIEIATDSRPDFMDSASAEDPRDISVSAVLLVCVEPSDPSSEFKVEARLCFDGVRRRKLTGLEGAVRPGLSEPDFVDEFDGPHKRPRNDVADFCTFKLELSFA